MRKRTLEPFVWLLFSAGGVLAALVLPVFILLFGLTFPLGTLSPPGYDHLAPVFRHPVTRVALFLLCSLALIHAAHRLRYTLYDGLQIKHLYEVVNPVCYGAAVVGSAAAAYLLFVAL
jgi:fumarate reductase subunit D